MNSVKGRELERVLALADELVETRERLRRAQSLESEIAHAREVEAGVPRLTGCVERHHGEIEEIARELERQWVDQGPLVSQWQRAVELSEQAEAAGADPAQYTAELDEARRRVEAARLHTRDDLDRLAAQREALVDAALAAPLELPVAEPVHGDGRPEQARRRALELIAYADLLEQLAARALDEAGHAIEAAVAELAEIGGAQQLQARVGQIEAELPHDVELPDDAPPSSVVRLERAGVAVAGGRRV